MRRAPLVNLTEYRTLWTRKPRSNMVEGIGRPRDTHFINYTLTTVDVLRLNPCLVSGVSSDVSTERTVCLC